MQGKNLKDDVGLLLVGYIFVFFPPTSSILNFSFVFGSFFFFFLSLWMFLFIGGCERGRATAA